MARQLLTPKAGATALIRQPPALTFRGSSRADWSSWRRRFRAALLRVMGPAPRPRPLRVRVLDRDTFDGYTRQTIAFDPDGFSTVVAYVLVPDGIRRGERRPGILCAHGHGAGKADLVEGGRDAYKQIAVQLVRAGYVVVAPDWRSFGERRDEAKYIGHFGDEHGGDGCDLSYMLYGYFGYQMLTLDVADARQCLDYLQSRRDVDGGRLGMIGCSFGGTMTTFTAALDRRVKAAVISGYLSTIGDVGDRGGGNTCGSQFVFGLRAIGDIADVAGLIAPRPCLVQIGKRDEIFDERDGLLAYQHLRRIYRAAGSDALELNHFDGGHEFHVPPVLAFLRRHLA
jgi:dienelactone hydrolase